VRRYYFPGVTHNGGRGGFQLDSPATNNCASPANPNSMSESLRALRLALTQWVLNNTPPPASRYPTLARLELVPPNHYAIGFPIIPSQPLPDNLINALPDYDFGPAFHYLDLSGEIASQPPPIRQMIPLLVPRTDADGKAERLASGDPRPSLEERYKSHQEYVSRIHETAQRLVQQRSLLQEDADRFV
jgi:hypothetical protein